MRQENNILFLTRKKTEVGRPKTEDGVNLPEGKFTLSENGILNILNYPSIKLLYTRPKRIRCLDAFGLSSSVFCLLSSVFPSKKNAIAYLTGIIVFLFTTTSTTFGQKASLMLENSEIKIGEQTTLHIYFEYQNPNEDALIGWPQFDKNLTDGIEIIDKTIDYEELKDSATFTYLREQKLVITAFEKGFYDIPSIDIELNDSVYSTGSELLKVNTVAVDTSKGIYDIKPNYQVKYTIGERTADWLRENWIWFAIIAVLIAIYFVWRLIKKYRKIEEPEIVKPKIPAHITALKILNGLWQKESWTSDDKKGFYSDMTDTVRRYLEERFGIYAMEQTTREIINNLQNADISEEDKEYLRKILSQADMVKFAKFKPQDEDGKHSLDRSIDFVKRTKKEEESNEGEFSSDEKESNE